MNRLLKILGIIFIVEHVVLIGVFLVLGISYAGTQKEAEDYITEKVTEIFQEFEIEILEPEISTVWKEKWPQEKSQVNAILQSLHDKMGGLVEIEQVQGETKSSVSVNGGSALGGNYSVKGKFQNGEGRIFLNLVKEDEGWKISSFTLSSSLLEIH